MALKPYVCHTQISGTTKDIDTLKYQWKGGSTDDVGSAVGWN